MKPGVLFELKNIGRPLAWIERVRFLSVTRHRWGNGFYQSVKYKDPKDRVCLIWKPELFEPKG